VQRMLGAATRLPAAETGRRGWGRVLIFQGPVKGLRKKSANATRQGRAPQLQLL